ncbi:hypothetical protein B9Z55_009893 [Caenorhabditis nigoni]|uniref:BTB domain-containing protein n=1 Tax=Caenorhabditis nigoni TaxID=1611254 RepID=A0A2G5UU03_9PELO|nr:hypothetical protein B9Z55_009893 [Caenorhabditis nigoni]
MSDIYRVSEDALAEKNMVITSDTNPQYAFVANYLWFFYVEDNKFRITAYFKDHPDIEYHASVKIWFKDEHFCHYERTEQFPFEEKNGDEYDITDQDWVSIEVTFRVTKLHCEKYIGPPETEQVGTIVVVGDQKVFLNMETVILQSEVLSDAFNNSEDVTIKLCDMDPDVFFEMLRVLNPPFKRISKHYFTELLLLGCRFRMHNLLVRLDEFSKSADYDPNWITRVAWKKIQAVLREDPAYCIQVLDNFRLKQREVRPVRKVRIRHPEVSDVYHEVSDTGPSCIGSLCNFCSNHKTQIIYFILCLFLIENFVLFIWFLSVYKKREL